MAQASDTIVTSGAGGDFVATNAWKIIQGELAEGIQFNNAEWDMAEEFTPPEDTPYSARQVLIPLDIYEDSGVAMIPEFGTEARESSANLAELTISLVQANARFNASQLSHYADKGSVQVKRQLLLQGAQKVRALSRHYSDYFYGVSNAYLAQLTAAHTATTMTCTFMNAYGQSGITNTTYIGGMFRAKNSTNAPGDYVALVRSGALVSNAIGQLGSYTNSSGVAVITWNGSVTSVSGDYVVKANSKENTTIAGTDYSRGLVGLIDMTTTASVHGVSSATISRWDVAGSDTTGGRLNGVRVTKADHLIEDQGGGKVTHLLMSRGVHRDWIAYERAALRANDTTSFETDGDIKSKGRKIVSTKRVPPGYCFAFDKSALSRWTLLPKPDGKFQWGDGKEYIDKNGKVFRIDMPMALICKNRQKLFYFTGLTES